MSVDYDMSRVEGNFLDRIAALERAVERLQQGEVSADTLEEMSSNLGEIRSGRFLAGEGTPENGDFTGSAMQYPAYEEIAHIYGMNTGELQWWADSLTGLLFAGGGVASIGSAGFSLLSRYVLVPGTDKYLYQFGRFGWGSDYIYNDLIPSPPDDAVAYAEHAKLYFQPDPDVQSFVTLMDFSSIQHADGSWLYALEIPPIVEFAGGGGGGDATQRSWFGL